MQPHEELLDEAQYDDEGRVISAEQIRSDFMNHIGTMLANVALGLFLIYLVLVAYEIFPIRIKDPAWMLSFASTVCNYMLFPLAGLVFLHISAAIAAPNHRLHARRRYFSRLAIIPLLGYLLLVPLIGFANWRGVRLIQTRQKIDNVRINKNNQFLTKEINAATSAKDLQIRLRNSGGPTLPDNMLNQPLPLLQNQAKEIISQATNFAKIQAKTPSSPEVVQVYWQSVKLVLLALLSAFCFASVTW